MEDLEYIKSNFIEENELCKEADISVEKLNNLVEKQLIPNSSYEIKTDIKITSPLQDEKVITQTKRYFHKSCINLIKQNINLKSKNFKEQFKKEYIKTLKQQDTQNLIYKSENELESVFKSTWKYFIDGVYGICTLNMTPTEIAKKGIAVQKLINFIKSKHELSPKDKQEKMIELNNSYNEVSSIFAPYQRKTSSRGKYIDDQLKKCNLEHLIKQYKFNASN